jgi:CHAT domain-containing protein
VGEVLAFDLDALVEELRASRITPELALERAAALKQDVDELLLQEKWDAQTQAWLLDVFNQWQQNLDQLIDDPQPTRVLDVGRVLYAVGAIFSRNAGARTGATVATVLIDRDREAWALEFFLDPLGGLDDLDSELRQEIRRLRATALFATNKAKAAKPVVEELLAEAAGRDLNADTPIGLFLLAKVLERLGDLEQALDKGREALAVRQTPGADMRIAYSEAAHHQLVGLLARSVGRFEEAIGAFEEARRLSQEADRKRAAANMLSEIGYTWQRAGDFERAQEFLDDAAAEAEAIGELTWAHRWRGGGWPTYAAHDENPADQLGRAVTLLHERPAKTKEARVILRDALQRVVEGGFKTMEHMVRNAIALSFSREGHFLQAEMSSREAVRVAADAGETASEMAYRANLARILASRGRFEEAKSELDAAIRVGEEIRQGNASAELRQTVGVILSSAYELAAAFASRQYTTHDGKESPVSATRFLDAAQHTRAVNLTRWLLLGELVEAHPEIRDTVSALRHADAQLEAAAEQRDRPVAPFVRAQAEARARWVALAAQLGLPAEPSLSISGVDEVNAVLPDRVVLDLLSLDEGVGFAVIRPDGSSDVRHQAGDREARTELIARWHRTLRRVLAGATRPARSAAADADLAEFRAVTTQLDDELTVPLARALEQIPSRTLAVFPHRELFQFPFWRLDKYCPGAEITVLPGAGAAAVLARRRRDGGGPTVAFGDVTGTLPQAAVELSRIGFDLVEEPYADRMTATLAAAGQMHFAGHGYFDRRNPYYSGLVVHNPNGDAHSLMAADPWNLRRTLLTTAWIVAALDMPRCRLCVLSACYTGVPRLHPASEFTSLPAALLVAGSRNVVASLWPAHDAATRLLMELFYDGLRGPHAGRSSAALAAARRRLSEMTRDEAVDRLGAPDAVPPIARPFEDAQFTDAFQHYGVD